MAPKIVQELWAREKGTLRDRLVTYYDDKPAAEAKASFLSEQFPEYIYFVREYKNPARY